MLNTNDLLHLLKVNEFDHFVTLKVTCKNAVLIECLENVVYSELHQTTYLYITDTNHIGLNFKIDLTTNIVYEYGVNDFKQWTIKDTAIDIIEVLG
jgi:hypothetical protein